MQIYLAGPDVFYPDASAFGEAKQALCQAHGFKGLFPLDSSLDLSSLSPVNAGVAIYQANLALMQQADLIIANMTPFRGPGMDGGTAFEMGFMAAQHKPVYAYTLDTRLYAQRCSSSSAPRDDQGLLIERFDMEDNLMMCASAYLTAPIIRYPGDTLSLADHTAAFRQVLKLIQPTTKAHS